jgi:hypothetical protein
VLLLWRVKAFLSSYVSRLVRSSPSGEYVDGDRALVGAVRSVLDAGGPPIALQTPRVYSAIFSVFTTHESTMTMAVQSMSAESLARLGHACPAQVEGERWGFFTRE